MFYVYEWYNINNDEIFYVGKGCGQRYKQLRKRNKMFEEYYNSHQCDVRIIQYFEEEQAAFDYENKRIVELKQIGQAFCNLDNGGIGGVNFVWTPEMRKYKSIYNPMKDEVQRKRMSENNPMKDPIVAKKTAEKKQRAVIIEGVRYPSIKSVMEKYDVPYETVTNWCSRGITRDFEAIRYEDSEQVEFGHKHYKIGLCKPVVYQGKVYDTALDLANDIGKGYRTIIAWLQRGFDTKGNPCRHEGDNTNYTYIDRYKTRKRNIPIIINNVRYANVCEASEKLGINKSTIYGYLRGDIHNDKYICTYDNQQPSQENSDNSILEGSTTNG